MSKRIRNNSADVYVDNAKRKMFLRLKIINNSGIIFLFGSIMVVKIHETN